jgi:methionine sulfoxide reductase catalytic subunit
MFNRRRQLTVRACEMNGKPVSVPHGAPLRPRCENEIGFKMVKWIAAIDFVRGFAGSGPVRRLQRRSRVL